MVYTLKVSRDVLSDHEDITYSGAELLIIVRLLAKISLKYKTLQQKSREKNGISYFSEENYNISASTIIRELSQRIEGDGSSGFEPYILIVDVISQFKDKKQGQAKILSNFVSDHLGSTTMSYQEQETFKTRIAWRQKFSRCVVKRLLEKNYLKRWTQGVFETKDYLFSDIRKIQSSFQHTNLQIQQILEKLGSLESGGKKAFIF